MVVGICTIQLYLPENTSLKGKRTIINSIKERVRNKFNITIAEVGNLELWQRTTLAVAYVSNDQKIVDAVFPKIINFIENLHKAEILDHHYELLHYNLEN